MGLSDDNFGGVDQARPLGKTVGQRGGIVRSERVTSRGTRAVPLADLKAELRIEHSEEDARLQRILEAATANVENSYGLAAGEQRLVIGVEGLGTPFRLPRVPASEIIEVKGGNNPAGLVPLDLGRFRLGPAGNELRVKDGLFRFDYHSVTFDAGYPARGEDVPPNLTEGILLAAVDLYESGGVEDAGTDRLPVGARALLQEFRHLSI